MQIIEFNNRPFLLKSDKVHKRDRQIYNALTEKQDIYYPYEVEMANGERVTKWRMLTTEEVRILLDSDDTRPLVERLKWDSISDSTQNEGHSVEVKRVAPVAHILFSCTLADKDMYVSSYNVMLSLEDAMYLVGWVTDHEFGYGNDDLKNLKPELYKRITDKAKLPGEITETSVLLLTTAEQYAKMLLPEGDEGGQVYDSKDESDCGHFLTLSICKEYIVVQESIIATWEFEDVARLVINDTESFYSIIGAYLWESLCKALNTMYSGKDATLCHLMEFLDKTGINYAFEKEDTFTE